MHFPLSWPLLGTLAAAVWAYMTLLWLLSLRLRDASLADIAWGPGFLLVTLVAWLGSEGAEPRRLLVLVLVATWAIRLATYLLLRNWGRGEDPRYAKWRREAGPSFGWRSYFKVFLLQGTILLIVALPLAAAVAAPHPSSLTAWDALGLTLWLLGMYFEVVGDAQLMHFKRQPEHRGQLLTTGLWRYTRHPNYFGEAVLWWGYGAIACAVPGGSWLLFSPLLMTFLLLKVSGVAMLERSMKSEKPGYAAYLRRTNAFLPGPPKP